MADPHDHTPSEPGQPPPEDDGYALSGDPEPDRAPVPRMAELVRGEYRRRRQNDLITRHCARCDYPLRTLEAKCCPECGLPIELSVLSDDGNLLVATPMWVWWQVRWTLLMFLAPLGQLITILLCLFGSGLALWSLLVTGLVLLGGCRPLPAAARSLSQRRTAWILRGLVLLMIVLPALSMLDWLLQPPDVGGDLLLLALLLGLTQASLLAMVYQRSLLAAMGERTTARETTEAVCLSLLYVPMLLGFYFDWCMPCALLSLLISLTGFVGFILVYLLNFYVIGKALMALRDALDAISHVRIVTPAEAEAVFSEKQAK